MTNKRSITFLSNSPEKTIEFGEALGRRIGSGVCVSLVGPLGAGKTVLIGGICRGLGVEDEVVSPTFILYEEFSGRLPVVHVDLYRLEHESEIEELGLFDLAGGDTVILAEWGERSEKLLAGSDAVVEIEYVSPNRRKLELRCESSAAEIIGNETSWLP